MDIGRLDESIDCFFVKVYDDVANSLVEYLPEGVNRYGSPVSLYGILWLGLNREQSLCEVHINVGGLLCHWAMRSEAKTK